MQNMAFKIETAASSPNEAPTRSVRKLTTAWLCYSFLFPSFLFATLFRCPQAVGISLGEPNSRANGHTTTERWSCWKGEPFVSQFLLGSD